MGRKLTHRPSFFKVLIGDFTEKLSIPPRFIKHFNGMVPGESILRGPCGGLWHLKIDNVENKLFFQKGWSDFVKDHSLEFGDFLIFKYIGNLKFAVKMYGRSACEKKLQMSKKNINKPIPRKKKDRRKKAKKRAAANNQREGDPEASCAFKAKCPYFTSCWNRNKKNQLGIPRTFLRNVVEELSDDVVLKDSGGKVWSIELRKAGDKVWLHNGWQEFVEYHCLCDQHLLHFRYNGNSHFHVLIFDTSVHDMEHSTDSGNHKEDNLDIGSQLPDNKETEEEVESFEVMGTPCQTRVGSRKEVVAGNAGTQSTQRRDVSPLPQQSLQFSEDETKSQSNEQRSMSPSESPKTRKLFDQNESDRDETRHGNLAFSLEDDIVSIHSDNGEPSKPTLPQTLPNIEDEGNKAPSNSIGAVQPPTPFAQDMDVQFNESNHNKSPSDEMQSCFPQQEHSKEEVLADQGNQRTQPNARESIIKQEAKENSSGLPFAEIYSPYKSSSAILGRERAFQVECAFNSEHPFFTVTMRPSYLCKRYLHIPSRFANKYLITKGLKVIRLRNSGNKIWPAAYIVRRNSTQLMDGWYSFVDDNKLKEGDICVFELIDMNDLDMKVNIFRFVGNAPTQIFPAN